MRKLLGYRLKEEKYREAASEIAKGSHYLEGESDYFSTNSQTHKLLLQAGVMHWFEEVYEEEKFTGWAKDDGFKNEKWIGYFDKGVLKYGVDANGDWFSIASNEFISSTDRPATTEEIQQALIKEATKRGFKEGVRFKGLGHENKRARILGIGSYSDITKKLFWYSSGELHTICGDKGEYVSSDPVIFCDGKWAEILPTETLNGKTAIIDGVEYQLKIK